MLVGFLALLCPHKEVHMIKKKNLLKGLWNCILANHRSLRIFTLISWGTIRTLRGTIWMKNNSLQSTLESIVPATHSLKSAMFAFWFANCSISVISTEKMAFANIKEAYWSSAHTAKRTYGKAFFAKLFAARQKAGGPACNAGGFLGTSPLKGLARPTRFHFAALVITWVFAYLPRQRSAYDIKEY